MNSYLKISITTGAFPDYFKFINLKHFVHAYLYQYYHPLSRCPPTGDQFIPDFFCRNTISPAALQYFNMLLPDKYAAQVYFVVYEQKTLFVGHVVLESTAVISVCFIQGISGMNETFYYWFTSGTFDEWNTLYAKARHVSFAGSRRKRNRSRLISLLFLFFSVKGSQEPFPVWYIVLYW